MSIPTGTSVRIQRPLTKLWDTTGVVISSDAKRDYQVRTTSGRVYRRNRRFIRPDKLPHTEAPSNPDPSDKPLSPIQDKPKRTRGPRRRPTPSTVPPRRSARLAHRSLPRPVDPSTPSKNNKITWLQVLNIVPYAQIQMYNFEEDTFKPKRNHACPSPLTLLMTHVSNLNSKPVNTVSDLR